MKNRFRPGFGPLEKPVTRPAKRFQELPGGVLKRESGKFGGPVTKKGDSQDFDFVVSERQAKEAKRPVGVQEPRPAAKDETISLKGHAQRSKYAEEREEYERERLAEDKESLDF